MLSASPSSSTTTYTRTLVNNGYLSSYLPWYCHVSCITMERNGSVCLPLMGQRHNHSGELLISAEFKGGHRQAFLPGEWGSLLWGQEAVAQGQGLAALSTAGLVLPQAAAAQGAHIITAEPHLSPQLFSVLLRELPGWSQTQSFCILSIYALEHKPGRQGWGWQECRLEGAIFWVTGNS